MSLAALAGRDTAPAAPAADALDDAVYRYHLLRAALAAGWSNLAEVPAPRLAALADQARQARALEDRVLASAEAAAETVTTTQIVTAMAAIRERYTDGEQFSADLARNGLTETALRHALERELIFNAVMQRIAAAAPVVTEAAIEQFYRAQQARFSQPEQRTARHILITVNADFPENQPTAAWRRITDLAAQLAAQPERFAELAQTHSECPSALRAGELGTVTRGQLYSTLDAALFALEEHAISAPVASELGYHLLWCERLEPARTLALDDARPRIRRLLQARAARDQQKAWLARLPVEASASPVRS